MPHATGDEMEVDEGSAIQQFLQGRGLEGGADYLDHEIDQHDKADDAVDYEDISDDDDLPDEEQASNRPADDDADSAFPQDAFGTSPELPHANGYHDNEPPSDDLFGGGEEAHDLFGERFSSPEQERHAPAQAAAAAAAAPPPPPRQPGSLALPSKSGLALPGGHVGAYQRAPPAQPSRSRQPQYSPTSLSPPSIRENGFSEMSPASMLDSEEEEFKGLSEMERAQMELFKRAKQKGAGQGVEEEDGEIDMDRFYAFFPDYDAGPNPNFTELFPQRRVKYRGKAPPKPPKPVQPTKLSLDLLQDQERSFKSATVTKHGDESGHGQHLVYLWPRAQADKESDDGLELDESDNDELIGGLTMEDLSLLCQDWDTPLGATEAQMEGEWETEEQARPTKKPKLDILDSHLSPALRERQLTYDEPERAAAKVAKAVTLDLNDVSLLIDEHVPQNGRRMKRIPGDIRRDPALAKDLAKRYNISNDEAYDLLKENHQHKVRSMLGGTTIEHSMPARKLQYPFYKVALETKARRSFHRPALDLRLKHAREEFRMARPKTVKRKERRGKDIKELFATAESLALNDNANMLLLEYSEEAPMAMSNFGMGNKLANFYRKRNAEDQERPKREIGETQVLLTQDKSPFANFGHVDQGEIVPTLQNGLYRAPVFQHPAKPTDFLIAISTTHSYGSRMYLRNMENLHTVGQLLPVSEIPGEHSRRVTDAAKKRLRAIAYRIYTKSQDPTRRNKQLDNISIMAHLKGHDMPQTRSKMREFMKYERPVNRETGVWVPLPGQPVPDAETLRGWVKPEDVCLLDSMQVGVQHLTDLGLNGGKDDDDKDVDEDANIEVKLAPWNATKNFLNATQGKAMLTLHGEGDPTGRGEGFSFVKTSMKGGFQPQGESVEDKLDAKKRRENGGHSYNVAKQQKAYDDFIRLIWDKQKHSLNSNIEISDTEMDDDIDAEPDSAHPAGRAATPRSSFAGTPAPFSRRDDETGTQFSRTSADRHTDRVLVIKRVGKDAYGNRDESVEKITNPRVIREYRRRRNEKRLAHIDIDKYDFDGKDPELDKLVKQKLEDELARIQRNQDRRIARERAKARASGAGSPPAYTAGSPAPSDGDGPASGGKDGTPQKGRGRNKDGTARKCANCGQVGHIKTNRKLCPLLNGTMKTEDANPNGENSFGAVAAPLAL